LIPRSPRTGLPLIPKSPPGRSARCGDPPPAALLAGIAQFNAGDFWHCHETLESLWRGEPDPIRALYQGILLVGVGYYHLQRGNPRGALAKLSQGVACLEPFRPVCMGIAVGELADAATAEIGALGDGTPSAAGVGLAPPPKIRLVATDGA
jgi:uncharacterized protein